MIQINSLDKLVDKSIFFCLMYGLTGFYGFKVILWTFFWRNSLKMRMSTHFRVPWITILTILGPNSNYNIFPSHFMPGCIHMRSHCLPYGRLWSVVGLTGISSLGCSSWLAIQPSIKPPPATLCFLISDRDFIKPNVWTETHNHRSEWRLRTQKFYIVMKLWSWKETRPSCC